MDDDTACPWCGGPAPYFCAMGMTLEDSWGGQTCFACGWDEDQPDTPPADWVPPPPQPVNAT